MRFALDLESGCVTLSATVAQCYCECSCQFIPKVFTEARHVFRGLVIAQGCRHVPVKGNLTTLCRQFMEEPHMGLIWPFSVFTLKTTITHPFYNHVDGTGGRLHGCWFWLMM